MNMKVSPNGKSLELAITDILRQYDEDVSTKADEILKQTANRCKNDVQANSPVRDGGSQSGNYKSGWAIKKNGKLKGASRIGGYVVHNKTNYQLTHLLEYGHVSKNQYGTYGRVKAYPHIKEAESNAIDECINRMENEL